LHIRFKD